MKLTESAFKKVNNQQKTQRRLLHSLREKITYTFRDVYKEWGKGAAAPLDLDLGGKTRDNSVKTIISSKLDVFVLSLVMN